MPLVVLLGIAALVAVSGVATGFSNAVPNETHSGSTTHSHATTTEAATPQPACSVQDEHPDMPDTGSASHYIDGLGAASTTNWTAGETLRIGADGDCSLGVRANDTATLTAATVNTSQGTVTGVVDVGRGGAFRVVERPDGNTTASVSIRNVGRENNDRVDIVSTNESGTMVTSERVTAPTGRFFVVEIQWYPNGTAQVALWDTDRQRQQRVTRTVSTSAETSFWQVQLDGRAYLDEIAVGSHNTEPADTGEADNGEADTEDSEQSAATPVQSTASAAQSDETGTPETFSYNVGPEESEPEESQSGLFLGPLIAIGGALMYRYAYGVTKFNEQMDAIGSTTRSGEVEPADWNVVLTKLVGAAGSIFGLIWFLTTVFDG
ncbi:hypothetical protein ACODNH_09345 [Haloarcula sp. NS06]|uniref:hypothetical protein n=1 Tax=unclassified Haloarcula TaxID=2624677 RepID=UPI0027B23450|nr:hypothetical protein [Haloarcula sp. H-GB4]MDQ2073647.1 hypothetical protein [Haloarcula sp. H-GB4]